MTDIWFRPKTHGYGATPVNWKGWAAIAGYLVAVAGGTLLLLSPTVNAGPPGTVRILLWATLVGVATAAFFRLCKAHTDGEWKWRWGGRS